MYLFNYYSYFNLRISTQIVGVGIPNKEKSCWLISLLQLLKSTNFHHFLSGISNYGVIIALCVDIFIYM
jgi:hypothetical protein